jgi:hypothetical protein
VADDSEIVHAPAFSVFVAVSFFTSSLVGASLRGISPQALSTQTTASVQASGLLQQSLTLLVGNSKVNDVTLTGSARRIAGSADETGAVTFKALSSDFARFEFSFASGSRSEIRSTSNGQVVGSWAGPDGVFHPVPFHNLFAIDGTSPVLLLTNLATASSYTIALPGLEQKNEQSVYHLVFVRQFPDLPDSSLPQHLSQIDLFRDSSLLLPIALDFNIHPDDNALLDIPVELLFSDYRTVAGVKMPFRVQKSINNTLALDLQFDNAAINSGLTASTFSAQ